MRRLIDWWVHRERARRARAAAESYLVDEGHGFTIPEHFRQALSAALIDLVEGRRERRGF